MLGVCRLIAILAIARVAYSLPEGYRRDISIDEPKKVLKDESILVKEKESILKPETIPMKMDLKEPEVKAEETKDDSKDSIVKPDKLSFDLKKDDVDKLIELEESKKKDEEKSVKPESESKKDDVKKHVKPEESMKDDMKKRDEDEESKKDDVKKHVKPEESMKDDMKKRDKDEESKKDDVKKLDTPEESMKNDIKKHEVEESKKDDVKKHVKPEESMKDEMKKRDKDEESKKDDVKKHNKPEDSMKDDMKKHDKDDEYKKDDVKKHVKPMKDDMKKRDKPEESEKDVVKKSVKPEDSKKDDVDKSVETEDRKKDDVKKHVKPVDPKKDDAKKSDKLLGEPSKSESRIDDGEKRVKPDVVVEKSDSKKKVAEKLVMLKEESKKDKEKNVKPYDESSKSEPKDDSEKCEGTEEMSTKSEPKEDKFEKHIKIDESKLDDSKKRVKPEDVSSKSDPKKGVKPEKMALVFEPLPIHLKNSKIKLEGVKSEDVMKPDLKPEKMPSNEKKPWMKPEDMPSDPKKPMTDLKLDEMPMKPESTDSIMKIEKAPSKTSDLKDHEKGTKKRIGLGDLKFPMDSEDLSSELESLPPFIEVKPLPLETAFIAKGTNNIAAALLQGHRLRENYAFSPLSYDVMLAIIAEGARGETYEELATLLELPKDPLATREGYRNTLKRILDDERGPLDIRTRLYAYGNVSVYEEYSNIIQDYYLTKIKVNQKCEGLDDKVKMYGKKTSDMDEEKLPGTKNMKERSQLSPEEILELEEMKEEPEIESSIKDASDFEKKFLVELAAYISRKDSSAMGRPETKLFLLNEVYFRANWTIPFVKKPADGLRPFNKIDGSQVFVDTLEAQGFYGVADLSDLNSRAVEIKYDGNRYSLVIVTPKQLEKDIRSLAEDISQKPLAKIMEQMKKREMRVIIPTFKIFTLSSGRKWAKNKKLFQPESADLSGLTPIPGLYIKDLVQTLEFAVDANITDASSLAGSFAVARSFADEYPVNQPFLYYVVDNLYGNIVINGKVTDPTSESSRLP